MKRWLWLLVLLPSFALAERKWRVKEECALIPNPANDGDSFHVKWRTQKYIFRLLFVDACESDDSIPERLVEQAEYFGIAPKDVVRVGKAASKFATDWLKEPFTVYTQFDDPMGRSDKDRDYAMVVRGDEHLAVELVRNGYARIYGKQEVPDDMPSVQTIRFRLKKAESEAKQDRRGAWAFSISAGAAPVRAPAAAPAADVAGRTMAVSRTVPVYSLVRPGEVIGHLTAGKEVTVVSAESPGMLRVRFTTASGQMVEAQCRRADLGI
jgi:endonuclease YncB( thermonuclease family)